MTGFLDLLTSMTLNDIESPKEGLFMNFSQFLTAAHILIVNCDEMVVGRPRQPAYKIFNIKRKF